MPSTPQTVPLIQVFDYILVGNTPQVGTVVSVTLNYSLATFTNPIVAQVPLNFTTKTDGNGYWTLSVPANAGNAPTLSPANTTYSVQYDPAVGYKPYLISVSNVAVPGGGWQASTISVSSPVALAPTASTVGALTVTGLLTAQAGLTVSGGATTVGAITASGLVTGSAGLTISAGAVSLPAASIVDATLSSNIPLKNAANVFTVGTNTFVGLSAGASGVASSGGLNVSAGASTLQAATLATGDLTLTTGRLLFSTAASKIIPGATSISHRNNADTADNLLITDLGLSTLRNALIIPPGAGLAAVSTNYGTVETELVRANGDGITNAITLTIPNSSQWTQLTVDVYGRATNAVQNNDLQVQLAGDSTAVYEWERGYFSGAAGAVVSSQGNADTKMILGYVAGTTAPANTFFHARFTINFANSTTLDKVISGEFSVALAYSASNLLAGKASGWWHNAAPATVTSVKLITSAGFFATTALATVKGRA